MPEFQPPEIEQAYKQATLGLVPELGLWDRIPDTEELEDLQRQTNELLAELRADGLTGSPWHSTKDEPEDIHNKAALYVSLDSFVVTGKSELKNDNDLRELIGFILQGLVRRSDQEPGLFVRYEPNRVDTVPRTIFVHSETKGRDQEFATLASWVIAKMLTPEVIDTVLNDKTRQPPILNDSWNKFIKEAQEERSGTQSSSTS